MHLEVVFLLNYHVIPDLTTPKGIRKSTQRDKLIQKMGVSVFLKLLLLQIFVTRLIFTFHNHDF